MLLQISQTSGPILRQQSKVKLDEDEYRIKDESGKIKVYTGWQNNVGLKVGDNVTVKGYLDRGFFREFYASEITLQNGEIIILKKDE
jgi:uncharacterized protein YdeI (BOF family)